MSEEYGVGNHKDDSFYLINRSMVTWSTEPNVREPETFNKARKHHWWEISENVKNVCQKKRLCQYPRRPTPTPASYNSGKRGCENYKLSHFQRRSKTKPYGMMLEVLRFCFALVPNLLVHLWPFKAWTKKDKLTSILPLPWFLSSIPFCVTDGYKQTQNCKERV